MRGGHRRTGVEVVVAVGVRRRGDGREHARARRRDVRLEDVGLIGDGGTAGGEARDLRQRRRLVGAVAEREPGGGVVTGGLEVGVDGLAGHLVDVDRRDGVEVGVEAVLAGVDQHAGHTAGAGDLGGLVDAGVDAALADHDQALGQRGVEGVGRAELGLGGVGALEGDVLGVDQRGARDLGPGDGGTGELLAVAEHQGVLEVDVRGRGDRRQPRAVVGDRGGVRAGVAGGGGDEDTGLGRTLEGDLDGVDDRVGRTGDGVVDRVHAVGDGVVDRVQAGAGVAAARVRVGVLPADLVDRQRGAGRHARELAEVAALDADVLDQGTGRGARGVRAVAVAVAGGEELGLGLLGVGGGDVLLECLGVVAGADDLGVADRVGHALAGLAGTVEDAAVGLLHPGAAVAGHGDVPLGLRGGGQLLAGEGGRLGPVAGVQDADDRAGPGLLAVARLLPGTPAAGQAEGVGGLPGVHLTLDVLGDQQHAAVGGQVQGLVGRQLGDEAVAGDGEAGQHLGADLAGQAVLLALEVAAVLGRGLRVGAERAALGGPGRRVAGVVTGVRRGGRLAQQDDVPPGVVGRGPGGLLRRLRRRHRCRQPGDEEPGRGEAERARTSPAEELLRHGYFLYRDQPPRAGTLRPDVNTRRSAPHALAPEKARVLASQVTTVTCPRPRGRTVSRVAGVFCRVARTPWRCAGADGVGCARMGP